MSEEEKKGPEVMAPSEAVATGPAQLSNKFYVTVTSAGARIAFTEVRPGSQEPTNVPPAVSEKEPPLTEKIQMVLQEAYRRGLKGLEPKEIYDAIIAKGWSADLSAVRSTTWRIWKHEGRLSKPDPESPLYTVPEREKATDLLSSGEQSVALSEPEAQGTYRFCSRIRRIRQTGRS